MRLISIARPRPLHALAVALVAAICATGLGCAQQGACTGWSFQVGKPASIATNAILGSQVTQYGAQGLTSGPVAGSLGLFSADAVETAPMPRSTAREAIPAPRAALKSGCTLDDVCSKLDAVLRAVDPKSRTMPMSQD